MGVHAGIWFQLLATPMKTSFSTRQLAIYELYMHAFQFSTRFVSFVVGGRLISPRLWCLPVQKKKISFVRVHGFDG
jgi:hypothetical protein